MNSRRSAFQWTIFTLGLHTREIFGPSTMNRDRILCSRLTKANWLWSIWQRAVVSVSKISISLWFLLYYDLLLTAQQTRVHWGAQGQGFFTSKISEIFRWWSLWDSKQEYQLICVANFVQFVQQQLRRKWIWCHVGFHRTFVRSVAYQVKPLSSKYTSVFQPAARGSAEADSNCHFYPFHLLRKVGHTHGQLHRVSWATHSLHLRKIPLQKTGWKNLVDQQLQDRIFWRCTISGAWCRKHLSANLYHKTRFKSVIRHIELTETFPSSGLIKIERPSESCALTLCASAGWFSEEGDVERHVGFVDAKSISQEKISPGLWIP